MARRDRDRRPARLRSTQAPKKRLLLVCEGEASEPDYLQGFQRIHREAMVEVHVAEQHGDPKYLVEKAKELAREARRKAKTDPLEAYDEVWVVCDVDDHARLPDARQMARDNGIRMVVSNPCIELWFLLHFRDSPGARHRHDVQTMLENKCRADGLKSTGKHVDAEELEPKYAEAMTRAQRMRDDAIEMDEEGRNPSTDIFFLTESICGR